MVAAVLAFAALAAATAAAVTPDYAREQRLADQVAPSVMVGDPVWLEAPDRDRVLALYTPAQGQARGGVVVVHGLGVQPDFGMIGELRAALAGRGYATLSVQMPVLGSDAPAGDYPSLFPVAGDRLDAAVRWLGAKGVAPVAVVAHSMGAAMANAWLARPQHAKVAAFVPIGMGVPFAATRLPPVLDIVAENDLDAVKAAAPQRAPVLGKDACSGSRTIAGADHYLAGRGEELAGVIAAFLDRAFGAGCRSRT